MGIIRKWVNVLRMNILLRLTYCFQILPIQVPKYVFKKIQSLFLFFYLERCSPKRPVYYALHLSQVGLVYLI